MKKYWKTKIENTPEDKDVLRLFKNIMTADSSDGTIRLNVLNLITMDLVLGNKAVNFLTRDKANVIPMQQRVFATQEYALLIAANWDVQERIYKYLTAQDEEMTDYAATPIKKLFEKMDEIIQGITDHKLWDTYQSCFFSSCSKEVKEWTFLYGDPPSFLGRLNQGLNVGKADDLYFEVYVNSRAPQNSTPSAQGEETFPQEKKSNDAMTELEDQ